MGEEGEGEGGGEGGGEGEGEGEGGRVGEGEEEGEGGGEGEGEGEGGEWERERERKREEREREGEWEERENRERKREEREMEGDGGRGRRRGRRRGRKGGRESRRRGRGRGTWKQTKHASLTDLNDRCVCMLLTTQSTSTRIPSREACTCGGGARATIWVNSPLSIVSNMAAFVRSSTFFFIRCLLLPAELYPDPNFRDCFPTSPSTENNCPRRWHKAVGSIERASSDSIKASRR